MCHGFDDMYQMKIRPFQLASHGSDNCWNRRGSQIMEDMPQLSKPITDEKRYYSS